MKAFFCGEWRNSENEEVYNIEDLLSGEVLESVPKCTEKDAKDAIKFAKEAQKELLKLSVGKRIEVFLKAAEIMDKYKDEVLKGLIDNSGQTVKYGSNGFNVAKQILRNSAFVTNKLHSEVIKSRIDEKFMYTLKEPLGVITIIIPINAPLLLALTVVLIGILSGNSIILKPARETPLPALILAKVLDEAGLPKGAFSVLTGFGKDIGKEIVSNEDVNGVVFFGSPRVGKEIAKSCIDNTKKIMLNYSGKNPLIIMDDADIDRAVDISVKNCYVNAGQICMATELLLVSEKIYDEFKEKLVERTLQLKSGDNKNPEVDVGPIPVLKIAEGIKAQLDEATSMGARILCGGKIMGCLVEPTVIEVSEEMSLALHRTSGPIAPLIKISSLSEGIRIANKSRMGFRAGIFTDSHKNITEAISKMNFAVIAINGSPFYMEEHNPHGGVDKAGMGGAKFLVDEMTQTKLIIDYR